MRYGHPWSTFERLLHSLVYILWDKPSKTKWVYISDVMYSLYLACKSSKREGHGTFLMENGI